MTRIRGGSEAAIALVLALSACSADSGGAGGRSVRTAQSSTTTPESIHDGLAAPAGSAGTAPTAGRSSAGSPRAGTAAAPNANAGNRPTTTTAGRSNEGTPTTTTTASAVGPTTTVPPGLPPEKCPDARTCRRYAYLSGTPYRWRIVDGRARIPFEINPLGCGLSEQTMRTAMEDGARPWERAAPTLDFEFAGFTERLPVPHDGHNVIACTGSGVGNPSGGPDGFIEEADMLLGAGLTYTPCEQADNSCTPLGGDGPPNASSLGTHEFGHWLWLRDMNQHELERELTMSPGDNKAMGERSRHWSTLALGDVLGIRSLYPCSCPLPPIYTP